MTLTDYVWIAVLVFLLLYDLWAVSSKNVTLSEVVWRVSMNRPIIPFLAGVVTGHFFWQAVR